MQRDARPPAGLAAGKRLLCAIAVEKAERRSNWGR